MSIMESKNKKNKGNKLRLEDSVGAFFKEMARYPLLTAEEEVDLGPMVADFQIKKVEEFVEDARSKGATIHGSGKRLEGKGYYFPPTVISELSDDVRMLHEEPFGPLLAGDLPHQQWRIFQHERVAIHPAFPRRQQGGTQGQ